MFLHCAKVRLTRNRGLQKSKSRTGDIGQIKSHLHAERKGKIWSKDVPAAKAYRDRPFEATKAMKD